jgi:hypothetical protein
VLHEAHGRFQLPRADDRPEWFEQCRSGRDIDVRPEAISDFAQLSRAQLSMLDELLGWYSLGMLGSTRVAQDQHAHALQSYMSHHDEYSPGRPLLQRSFGEAAAERDLNECLCNCSSSASASRRAPRGGEKPGDCARPHITWRRVRSFAQCDLRAVGRMGTLLLNNHSKAAKHQWLLATNRPRCSFGGRAANRRHSIA